MKKLFSVMLLVSLLISAFAVPAMADGQMAGGWTVNADNPTVIPQEVTDAFNKAVEGWTGSNLEPVAYLASQVVAGSNYCLLCKSTLVTLDPTVSYVFVYIYADLEGNAEILRIADIDYSAFEQDAE